MSQCRQLIRFCAALVAKYADKIWDRPKGFYPRLDDLCVYAIKIERLTDKETLLAVSAQRCPAVDKTKSQAKPDSRIRYHHTLPVIFAHRKIEPETACRRGAWP